MRTRVKISAFLTVASAVLLVPLLPSGAAGATGLNFELVAKVSSPTALTSHPSDPDRILMTERRGKVRVIERGTLKSRPLLDISRRVNSTWVEQGLLGIAMAPDYRESRRFYILFTRTDGDLVVEEWRTRSDNRDVADTSSRRQVIRIPSVAERGSHNGGVLRFLGEKLFITVGDGNDPGDYLSLAQNPFSLRGKILRIVPRPDRNLGRPYSIPTDNPFTDGSGRPEVFATGLRNPHALFFHRDPKGGPVEATVYDVGHLRFEEVNHLRLSSLEGANFGWKIWEGLERYDCGAKCPNATDEPPGLQTVRPVHVYGRAPDRCAVIGGPVVRDRSLVGLTGRLLFGDYCSSTFQRALPSTDSLDPVSPVPVKLPYSGFPRINGINEDATGRIYVLIGSGQVLRLRQGR